MRKLILTLLTAATAASAQAQLFSHDDFGNAIFGGLIGGIIGHNSGRRTAEGIGIGAGAGLLLGALAEQNRPRYYNYDSAVPYASSPVMPSYVAYRPQPALTGAVLGGIAGGVIGHNSGRRTAEGIAIGAASGMVLGALAEGSTRQRVRYVQPVPTYAVQNSSAPVTTTVQQTAPAPAPASYSPAPTSPMASANSLFGR